MLSGSTARTLLYVEVSVLVVFFAWMPFVFQVMPTGAEIAEFEAQMLELQSPATQAPALASVTKPKGSDDEKDVASAACVTEKAEPLDAKGLLGIATDGLQSKADKGEKKERCVLEPSRLSLLPFLVAFIGGGVFSLDAFAAFPML
eukprot:gnl/TRDRNA2_/TRDRNA2_178376_c0_seq1.p1 gnl/TRDRNA2_/TRDRNA2_178376_c0~~gnl/TRDRNA2_/TRDRNA2_178376_c0_seq1.p1  ORF type:complete len:146 (-),score=42.24 gnl/TRDRNA2_/TRDRNA2_178376_c0_seq1:195-632(-)